MPVIKKLFYLILNCGYFPSLWKKGFIINIHKADVKSKPNNYRGITLSSCLGKLFALIINNRLAEHLNIKNIYSEYQFGFRKEHCTTDSIYIIDQLMSHYRR